MGTLNGYACRGYLAVLRLYEESHDRKIWTKKRGHLTPRQHTRRPFAYTAFAASAEGVAGAHLPLYPVAFVAASLASNRLADDFAEAFVSSPVALDAAVPLGREQQDPQLGHG
jgi:hypothetical protein